MRLQYVLVQVHLLRAIENVVGRDVDELEAVCTRELCEMRRHGNIDLLMVRYM